jgi:hypothetical protein
MGGGSLPQTITFQQNPLRTFTDPCGNFPVFTQESFNQWITDTSNSEAPGFTDGSLNYLISFDAPYTIIGANVLENLSNIDICNTEGASLTDKFAHPEVLTDICDSAFRNMNLTGGLDFSEFSALKTIGPDAFSDNSFTSLELSGNTALTIVQKGSFAFNNFIDGVTFTNCPSLQSIQGGFLGDGGAFYQSNIGSLTFNTLPGLTNIGDINDVYGPFEQAGIFGALDLSGLTNLQTIGQDAFRNNDLTSVDLAGLTNLQTIGQDAFRNNDLTSVDLARLTNLQTIGKFAFNNNNISSVNFSGLTNLQTIGDAAFRFNNISSVDFSGLTNLQTIGGSAFLVNNISSVDFSGLTNLQTIGDSAFDGNITGAAEFRFFDNSGCTLGSNVYPDLSGEFSTGATPSIEWINTGFTIPTNGLYIWNV